MEDLVHTLDRLETDLRRRVPTVASRFQQGMTRAEIDSCIARFAWTLPEDLYDLYQWRNGLSGVTGKLSLVDKLLRMKDRWHGQLSGTENELMVAYAGRSITVKFMPLEFAIAGHRHLKLGRCPLDLLPVFVIADGKTKHYCMVQLGDERRGVVYCANGTKAPPWGITQAFLSEQPQFTSMATLVSFLAEYAASASVSLPDDQAARPTGYVACGIAAPLFDELRARFTSSSNNDTSADTTPERS
jgi:hypothetical protein